jgi:hypothetical protein
MDTVHFQQGLPPALREALHIWSDGGMLFAVARATPPAQDHPLIPCFLVRSPQATTHVELTTRLVIYEEEGPLIIFHAQLYHHSPQKRSTRVYGRTVRVWIQPPPFEVVCLLNPTVDEGRLMLQALATSAVMVLEFYGIDAAMTYQATQQYTHPVEQQQAVRQILKDTADMTSSPERFLAAQHRFEREHPQFSWRTGV